MPHCALVRTCKPVSHGAEGNDSFPWSMLAPPLFCNWFTPSVFPQPLPSPSPASYSVADLASYFTMNMEVLGRGCLIVPTASSTLCPALWPLPASGYRRRAGHASVALPSTGSDPGSQNFCSRSWLICCLLGKLPLVKTAYPSTPRPLSSAYISLRALLTT